MPYDPRDPGSVDPLASLAHLVQGTVRRDSKMADTMHDRVEKQILDFQARLAADQETAVCLANLGRDVTLVIVSLGYHNPELMVFYCVDALETRFAYYSTYLRSTSS